MSEQLAGQLLEAILEALKYARLEGNRLKRIDELNTLFDKISKFTK